MFKKKIGESSGNYKHCLMCGYMVLANRNHICTLNTEFCHYILFLLNERYSAVFYCLYCEKINISGQKVLCDGRLDSTGLRHMGQITLPFFCNNLNCEYHPKVKSCFCLSHTDMQTAELITYSKHDIPVNEKLCKHCNKNKKDTMKTNFCHKHYHKQPLLAYLNCIPPNKKKNKANLYSRQIRKLCKINFNVSVVHLVNFMLL